MPPQSDGASDSGRHRAPPPPRSKEQRSSFLRELPFILVGALVLSLLIKTFLVQAFYIPSGSMERTLLVGDRVFVNKLGTHFGEIHRGDVVVFRDPGGWLPAPLDDDGGGLRGAVRHGLQFIGLAPSATGDDLIKRVIGVGGDEVVGKSGVVSVNGVPLEEPYVFAGDSPTEVDFSVTVPAHELWVMGDHRSVSEDSRAHQSEQGDGFVPVGDVIGRAVVKVWPLSRFGGLHRPATFGQPALDR